VKVKFTGGVAPHPALPARGGVDDSVTINPLTPDPPTLSAAVKVLMGTVKEADVAGITKPVTLGGIVSAGRMMVTV
jgi:hypothetical protein